MSAERGVAVWVDPVTTINEPSPRWYGSGWLKRLIPYRAFPEAYAEALVDVAEAAGTYCSPDSTPAERGRAWRALATAVERLGAAKAGK